MPHEIPLITMLVAGLGLAFVLGAAAHRLRVSPIVGYLLAGVLIGPATPGYVADPALAAELAEIGVILLMFGVGLHFSLKDLLAVRAIAIPGALGQIAIATGMGVGLALAMGWSLAAGLVFGLALSVASTVVLLRSLQERRLVETTRGRIAVGWLVVEDLAMVLALVLLPALAGLLDPAEGATTSSGDLWLALAITLGKVVAFVALMLVVGRRAVPWVLHAVAHSGSRELFRLAVLSIALGFAYGAAELFGVSFALGAFFAGMILAESALSQRAAEEALPLRDAFGVLFFVSVGMLFDPAIVVEQPLPLLATVAIILVGKSVAAFGIVLAFGHSRHTAFTISASLAQIGEFSFILASLGLAYGLLPPEGQDLILAGAIISILANPLCFFLLDRLAPATPASVAPPPGDALTAQSAPKAETLDEPAFVSQLSGHAILVGFGRVGSLVGQGLAERREPHVVLEERVERVVAADGREIITGNAATEGLLAAAGIARARLLFVAIPEAFEAGHIVGRARAANAGLIIVARAHGDAEVEHLKSHGADSVIMGEREIARGMLGHAFPA